MSSKPEIRERPTLVSLPPHILYDIARELSKKDAGRLARTCTTLREAGESRVWREIDFDRQDLSNRHGYHDYILFDAIELFKRRPERVAAVRTISITSFGHQGNGDDRTPACPDFWPGTLSRLHARLSATLDLLPTFNNCCDLTLVDVIPAFIFPWLYHTPNVVRLRVEPICADFLPSTFQPGATSCPSIRLQSLHWQSYGSEAEYLAILLESCQASLRELTVEPEGSPHSPGPKELARVLSATGSGLSRLTTLALPWLAWERWSDEQFLPDLGELILMTPPPNDVAYVIPARPRLHTLTYTFDGPKFPIIGGRHCTCTLQIPLVLIHRLETAESLAKISIQWYDQDHDVKPPEASIREFRETTDTLFHIIYTDALTGHKGRAIPAVHLTSYRGHVIPYEVLHEVYATSGYDIDATFDSRQIPMNSRSFEMLDRYVETTADHPPPTVCDRCARWAHTLFTARQLDYGDHSEDYESDASADWSYWSA